jgi:uncharacterized protein
MILADTNLLLYAYNALDKQHTQARNWFEALVNGKERLGLCWPVITGFIRVSTNARAFLQPFDIAESVQIVTRWMRHPNIIVVEPTNRHWQLLSETLVQGQVRSAMTTDAEIATYAIEHGAVLHTADRDFSRFPKLKTLNPLGS